MDKKNVRPFISASQIEDYIRRFVVPASEALYKKWDKAFMDSVLYGTRVYFSEPIDIQESEGDRISRITRSLC